MNQNDDATKELADIEVAEELADILGKFADLMSEATFDDDENISSEEAIQRLRLAGKDSMADELGELALRADELKSRNRSTQ